MNPYIRTAQQIGNVRRSVPLTNLSRPVHIPPQRILVVGAGPAGVRAAGNLNKHGHHVTCWEATDEIGGRANSIEVNDNGIKQKIDYGAVGAIGSPNGYLGGLRKTLGKAMGGVFERALYGDYAHLFDLSERHKCKIIDFDTRSNIFDNKGNPVSITLGEMFSIAKEIPSYLYHLYKWNLPYSGPITQPHPELCQPWTTLVEQKGWHTLARTFNIFVRGAGYQDQGKEDETAAVYVAQYMNFAALFSLAFSGICGWEDGAQEMWKREAEELQHDGVNFHASHALTGIRREGNHIEACSSDGIWEQFDKVVFCSNPKLLIEKSPDGNSILHNPTFEEVETFSKLHTVDLRTVIIKATGLPDANLTNQFTFIEDRIDGKTGQFFSWFKKKNKDVYAFYINGSGLSEREIKTKLEADIEALGGKVERYFGYREWKNYFPHVDPKDMDYFERKHQLQGRDNLYYADASGAFDDMRSTVDHVDFVTELVQSDLEKNALQVEKQMND
jgi:hypothetical protein